MLIDDATPSDWGPLAGLVVLDLTVARAGPTAVRQFADWGAKVIRIEAPGGTDPAHSGRHSPDVQNLHRNKRAITIDLKHPDGRALFLELAAQADVVIENMRSDVKHRLGVDYESVRAVNPGIVYGSISGFGQDGPYADRPGMDQVAQGMSGLASVTGEPGGGPMRAGVPLTDLAAGLYLALGCFAALIEREQSGQGQWVTTSLLEAGIAMLDFQAARWTMAGDVAGQAGNHHPTLLPMGSFPTADGHVNICAPSNRRFRQLCELLGEPGLADSPDFATSELRSANRAQLNAEIGRLTAARPTAHWVDVINDAGMPCGPILSIEETFADAQVQHLEMAVPVEHAELGAFNIVRNAVSMSRTPHRVVAPAPGKGEHSDEVLAEFGIGVDRIRSLRAGGAI